MMKRGFTELNSQRTKNLNLDKLLLVTGGTALLFLTFLTLVLTLTFLTLNPSISEASEAHFGGEEVGDFQVHRMSAMPVLVLGTGGRIVQHSHSRQGHRMHPYSGSQHPNPKPGKFVFLFAHTECHTGSSTKRAGIEDTLSASASESTFHHQKLCLCIYKMEELGATIQLSNSFSSFPYTRGLVFMLTGTTKAFSYKYSLSLFWDIMGT